MHVKKQLLAICAVISACILLTVIGQCLPISAISKNIMRSKTSFSQKVSYPKGIANYISSQLDDFTDAIILTTAGYSGEESAVDRAFSNYRVYAGDSCESLQAYGTDTAEVSKTDYARYWLGSVFFVKLLLMFLDYSGIQMLNQILQLGLLALIIFLMAKKNLTQYIIPFMTAILWLMPGSIYLSIQYSAVYYVALILMVLILAVDGRAKQDSFYMTLFFCAGGVTNWLDFLTYPLITLGLPLVLHMVSAARNERKPGCADVIKISFCWAAGYFGMWILKWCLATAVLDKNVFLEAFNQAKFRTSQSYNGTEYSRIGVIMRNFRVMFKRPYLLLLGASVLYCIKQIWPVRQCCLRRIMPYGLTALMPIVWYVVLCNHSWIHYWFTYRILCISIFAFLCGVIQLKAEHEEERRNG